MNVPFSTLFLLQIQSTLTGCPNRIPSFLDNFKKSVTDEKVGEDLGRSSGATKIYNDLCRRSKEGDSKEKESTVGTVINTSTRTNIV